MSTKLHTALSTLAFTVAMAFNTQAQDVVGWDDCPKKEFVMPKVKSFIFVNGDKKDITRDVCVDCDLLVKGKTNDGKVALFMTTAFASQFNAESKKSWDMIPQGTRDLLQKSRYEKRIGLNDVESVLNHLRSAHGVNMETLTNAAKRCKLEYFRIN